MDFLLNQDWPGNVRELKNKILHDIILADESSAILRLTNHSTQNIQKDIFSNEVGLSEAVERVEKIKIEKALEQNEFNVSKTADILKVERNALRRRMQKHGIPFNNKHNSHTTVHK